jgi:hypothetical protein
MTDTLAGSEMPRAYVAQSLPQHNLLPPLEQQPGTKTSHSPFLPEATDSEY